jgi:hypothetical protein
MRTGRRCTTFTQLPEAFCGGRIANSPPWPGCEADAIEVWFADEARFGQTNGICQRFHKTLLDESTA